jgi:hypothetical protein
VTVIHIASHETEPFTFLMPSVRLTGIWLPDADVTPEQYLRYAELDLEDRTDRGAINALGNAKRALHLIVDSLLQAYGLLARNQKAGFPQKLGLIDAAGLFSPSILSTLNLEGTSWSTSTGRESRRWSTSDGSCCSRPAGWANRSRMSAWPAGRPTRHLGSSSSIREPASSRSSVMDTLCL